VAKVWARKEGVFKEVEEGKVAGGDPGRRQACRCGSGCGGRRPAEVAVKEVGKRRW